MANLSKFWNAARQPKLLTAYVLQKAEDYLLPWLWLCVSWSLRTFLSKGNTRISTIIQNQHISTVYFVSPEIGTNKILLKSQPAEKKETKKTGYFGPNLSEMAKLWFTEVVGSTVIECVSRSELKSAQDGSSIFATFASRTPAGPPKIIYFARILALALYLKKQKIPAVVFLPDTFYPDAAIVSSLLVGLTKGAAIFLQNSEVEASRFGYPNALGPIFWTWPPSRAGSRAAKLTWSSRENTCLVPAGITGGKARFWMAKRFSEQLLSTNQFSILVTDGSLSNDEYLSALNRCKLSMTTNYVQDNFHIGPRNYRERMTGETTTGRVWEAFSRGQVLICNETRVLEELGFVGGVHYLELATLLDGSLPLSSYTDTQLKQIAKSGESLFFDLSKSTKAIGLAYARSQKR